MFSLQVKKVRQFIPLDVLILISILTLSVILNFYHLNAEGFGNPYYAAGVKSMLMSWSNFFFVSFDPAGFISLDKPPLGFWGQAWSALVFGYHGWSLILPQALAGIITILVLYWIVRRGSGPIAGLLAALFMAVTPIVVATDRNNTIDSLVMLTSVLAAGAILEGVRTGKSRWLWASLAMIGLGFNIKMLQAYLPLPAILLVFLVAKSQSWRRIWIQLILSGLFLVVLSLAWMVVVDLTPPDRRPYVAGSTNNREFDLAFTYNGIDRLVGLSTQQGFFSNGPGEGVDGMMTSETSLPGPLRLFGRQLGGQVTWLLPVSILGLTWLLATHRNRTSIQFPASLFWGVWLVTGALLFTFAAFFHRQYLVMLAPPVAALAGMGIAAFWDVYRQGGLKRWLLPLAILIGGITTTVIILPFPGWNRWLLIPILLASVLSAGSLVISVLVNRELSVRWQIAILVLGISSLIVPQLIWAGIPVIMGGNRALPFAGPDVLVWRQDPKNEAVNAMITSLEDILNHPDNGRRFALGTIGTHYAQFLIVQTGKPVMAIGGYQGIDPVPSLDQLILYMASGDIRYLFLDKNITPAVRPDIWYWVTGYCSLLPPRPTYDHASVELLDCRGSPIGGQPAQPSSTIAQSYAVPPCTKVGQLWTSPADGMVLDCIPPGEFLMGAATNDNAALDNERPQHTIFLDAFWIDQTDVTNSIYAWCVQAGQCQKPYQIHSAKQEPYYGSPQFENYPVVYVSWDFAQAYCTWVGRRLPSEAQWEKAARGTDGRLYPWGNRAPDGNLLNFNQTIGDTTQVGLYPQGASPYGLLDMAGNVWQWVSDWYDGNYYNSSPLIDPPGPPFPPSGVVRVQKGGSWSDSALNVRSSVRVGDMPSDTFNYTGFRCSN